MQLEMIKLGKCGSDKRRREKTVNNMILERKNHVLMEHYWLWCYHDFCTFERACSEESANICMNVQKNFFDKYMHACLEESTKICMHVQKNLRRYACMFYGFLYSSFSPPYLSVDISSTISREGFDHKRASNQD